MKRLHTELSMPGEGAVYRHLDTCASFYPAGSTVDCGECIDTLPVAVISPPGCSSFPVTDNNYGALPTYFAGDVDIDSYGYDSRFEAVPFPFPSTSPICPVPESLMVYVDLWTLLGQGPAGLQADVLEEGCFCMGEGIDRPTLTIGKPRFPEVEPLPYFVFPIYRSTTISARRFNPDGPPVEGDCCPTSEDTPEHIEAEIVDGELRLRRRAKTPTKDIYRASDVDTSFQLRSGYPRKCCFKDDCGEDGQFVYKYLHFPQWPGPKSLTANFDATDVWIERDPRDPYDPVQSQRQEPLGLIPVVVDIQCDPVTGLLYVYHANIVVHDGGIAGLQWNTLPPRPTSGWSASDPPTAPEDLEVNKDYQDRDVFSEFEPLAGESGAAWCAETCKEAASEIGDEALACSPDCPAEETLCGEFARHVSTGFGASMEEATIAAFDQAVADTPSDCSPSDYYLCYSSWSPEDGQYKAAVAFCCLPSASSG
jgi:hypothetical protein